MAKRKARITRRDVVAAKLAIRRLNFKPGDRIVLLENKEEGWPRQPATIVGWDAVGKTLVVEVAREGHMDDGLREVTPDQIEGWAR
jgi:hypothetical protein